MKTQLLQSILFILIATQSYGLLANEEHNVSLFGSYEANGKDYISGIGTSILVKDEFTNFGAQLTTSLNHAEVISTDGYIEDFVSWETAVKFGYFSDIFFYGEAGIDLAELLFYDFRYDENDYHTYYEDDIDMYVGVGAGINLGHLSIEAFSRLREIDSRYWEAESEVFSGVRFSINF